MPEKGILEKNIKIFYCFKFFILTQSNGQSVVLFYLKRTVLILYIAVMNVIGKISLKNNFLYNTRQHLKEYNLCPNNFSSRNLFYWYSCTSIQTGIMLLTAVLYIITKNTFKSLHVHYQRSNAVNDNFVHKCNKLYVY